MHLPWKKVKTTRISQFVNDHLHKSQKRRHVSSLVVETGFPTSLVDLFIKNREKLKKTSKKKLQRDPVIAGSNPSSHSASPEIQPSGTFSPLQVPPNSPQPLPGEALVQNLSTRSSGDGLDEMKRVPEAAVDANTVLLVFLKMFFVLVLALCTKRLTIGLTISAFLFFFLEYVFKHSPAMLKPCSRITQVLKITVAGVLSLFKLTEPKPEQDRLLKPGGSRHDGEEEIQVVGSSWYLIKHVLDEIQPEDEIIEEGSSHLTNFGHRGIKFEEAASMDKEDSRRKLRKLNLKLKMMKFAPKKPRGARKEHELQRVDEIVREDYSVLSFGGRVQSISTGEISFLSISNRKHASFELLSTREEGDEIEGGELTWKHFVLCVIVLAGLIVGRVFAVLLALSWFLVLKLGESLPRCMKVCL